MNSKEHIARLVCARRILVLRIPDASTVTISPGSTSSTNDAPTTSRAHVSLVIT